ncbi:unnamed protein product, partial [Brassica rapa]
LFTDLRRNREGKEVVLQSGVCGFVSLSLSPLKKLDGRGLGVNNGGLSLDGRGLSVNNGGLDFVNGSLARWRRLNKLTCGVLGWWSPPQR